MLLVPPRGWWLLLLVPLLFGTYAEGMLRNFLFNTYPKAIDHPDQQWLWQKLDHFDAKSKEFWRQRFFINDRYYRRGGPVFLLLGGEESAVPMWKTRTSLLNYAKRMRALYVVLEHRYYGKSQPTKNISTDNLRFLSSRQALKDAVYFQKFLIKKLRLFRNKWVVFGGSYAGSLAAWLRVKHPRMFHSAVSYSAPIYAKANFAEYLEVVQNALFRCGRSECVDAVRNASKVLMYKLKHKEYHSNISRDFRLCEMLNIDSEVKMSYFLETLISRISFLVQYNSNRPLNQDKINYNFDQKLTENDITLNYFCRVMTDKSLGTPYERYVRFFNKNLETQEVNCWDANYEKFIATMRNPEWDGEAAEGTRQWLYQTCTEFGFFLTTDSKHQPFLGMPMSYYLDQCEKLFDLELDVNSVLESVKETNKYYYKPLIKTGKRILFVNGDIDPWHALSINSRRQRNLVGMCIKDSYHCEVILENSIDDPKNLKIARHFVLKTLLRWLPKRSY